MSSPLIGGGSRRRRHRPQQLIDDGCELNAFYASVKADGSWMQVVTLLTLASIHGHVPMVEMLIERGGDVDIVVGSSCETPLMSICHAGSSAALHDRVLPAMTTLLRHRASVNLQDQNGVTALMRASRGGNIRAIKLLLQHGAQSMQFKPFTEAQR